MVTFSACKHTLNLFRISDLHFLSYNYNVIFQLQLNIFVIYIVAL